MPPFRLWWLAVLLSATVVSADDSLCPCVPLEACSQSADSSQEESSTPCEDPTMVRCCEENDPSPPFPTPTHSEPLQMVSTDLEREQRFMEAINTLMEKMYVAAEAGENREEKSLDGTSKNTLNCDGQQCENKSAGSKEKPILQTLLDNVEVSSDSEDLPEHPNLERELNATQENTREEDRDKLVIVYAEQPNKNNTYEEKDPMIVYPSKEAIEEYLSEESSVKEQMLTREENIDEDEEQESDAVTNQQLRNGKPNLHKLFPKRNSPLKSSFGQTKPDDLGEAGSEIEEVKTTVPTNSQTERKPFRSIPKHLSHRPLTTDDSSQTSAFESQKSSRSKIGLTSPTHNEMTKDFQYHATTAAVMDEINLKAINDMMKANFTSRLSLARRQRPMWHPQSRLHSTTGTQHEPRGLPQSTNQQTSGSTTLLDQTQSRISGSSESEQHSTNSTSTEVKGSRYSRRRNQQRTQNVNQPPKFSTAVSMSQEQVFDTLKEAKPQEAARRRPSYRRPVKTQGGIPNIDLAEQLNSQSDPSFGRRRSKFRPRSKTDNMTPAMLSSNSEVTNPRTAQLLESKISTSNPTQNFGQAAQITHSETPLQSNVKYDGDLDGSGSEVQPQRVRVRGRFSPPQRMEKGFRPMFGPAEQPTFRPAEQMFGPAELNVVGPVPAGFHDRARGFPSEELGLELPRANVQQFQQFEGDQFQLNPEEEMEKQLPPVFPVAQPPTATGDESEPSSTFQNSFSDEDLLPPLETPKPLGTTSGRAPSSAFNTFSDEDLLPPLETPKSLEETLRKPKGRFPVPQPPTAGVDSEASMFRNTFSDEDLLPPLETPKPLSGTLEQMQKAMEDLMLDEHKDITELNQDFNQLKTRYDMLLNRYAQTLKLYNDRFRNLLASNDPSKN